MQRRRNPSASDNIITLALFGAIGVGAYYTLTNWDKITKAPGWQCNHPVTPGVGTAGLTYNKARCCWVNAQSKCAYLADGLPY